MNYRHLEEAWVLVNGLPVFFRRSTRSYPPGTPTLLHLHGFAISGTYLVPTADTLAADYPTYVPDLPGFGRSIAPKRTLGLPELADAAIAFMDAVGLQQVVPVGNSMGCIVAIEMARKYPERVPRAVLCSPAGGPYNRPLAKGVLQLAWDGLREPKKSMYIIAVPDYLRYGLLNMARLFRSMISYPSQEEAAKLVDPTLVVLGERDPLVSEEHALRYSKQNPQLVVIRIEGAAHAVNYSHPGELGNAIRLYLDNQQIQDDPAMPGTTVVLDAGFLGNDG